MILQICARYSSGFGFHDVPVCWPWRLHRKSFITNRWCLVDWWYNSKKAGQWFTRLFRNETSRSPQTLLSRVYIVLLPTILTQESCSDWLISAGLIWPCAEHYWVRSFGPSSDCIGPIVLVTTWTTSLIYDDLTLWVLFISFATAAFVCWAKLLIWTTTSGLVRVAKLISLFIRCHLTFICNTIAKLSNQNPMIVNNALSYYFFRAPELNVVELALQKDSILIENEHFSINRNLHMVSFDGGHVRSQMKTAFNLKLLILFLVENQHCCEQNDRN